ncbi:unnamed protein product, partial [Tetraodon nigroviridis]
VFGKSLVDTVTYEQRFGPRTVPILVQKCVEFIQEHGLTEEGIFRLPGQDNAVKQFREAFDAGERPSFPSDTDVHTVASLLKLYLRELPEPVVPWTQYQDFLDCTSIWDSNNTEALQKLEQQIALLPRTNYDLLSYICRFLFEVQLKATVNKMNVENLATVMGINLLKPQIEDPITVMKATPLIQKLMTVMISQHQTLFPASKDTLPCPPSNRTENQKNTPRSFVGWESAEMAETSPSESPEEEEDSPTPDKGRCSPPVRPTSPSSDLWYGGPRKRTQTLPTFNCPLTGMAAKAEALNRWSRVPEISEEKGGTLSEDIFKILDLQESGSLFRESKTKTEEGGETVPTQTGGDDAGSSAAGSSAAGSSAAGSRDARNDDPVAPVTSPQKGVTEVLKSGAAGPVKSRTEQKKEEQPPTERLQQDNTELRAKVAELQSALADYHRRVAALEICLRNAERSRDEAQRRNEELQRDIQQFLTSRPQAPT